MYESHFGFKSAPFQLNPDPEFFFDSPGHSKALAHLRYGVQQGEGFIVITGEVGAGKTTLVRALLQQLDPGELVAAQLMNTQLDADNLLQAILTAFGVPTAGLTKAEMLARFEAFLTSLAANGRRALLVIDEAQNLSTQALEELRMLSNYQLGRHGLLQSFLVGQPELRELLKLPSMLQFQQRVLATYHLGPLSVGETAAYVQHRLRHVGWSGRKPSFAPSTWPSLHERSGGIPRRINVLCNRVLLAAYLGEEDAIAASQVDEVADELEAEFRDPAHDAPALRPVQTIPPEGPRRPVGLPRHSVLRPPADAEQTLRKYKLEPGTLLAIAGDASSWGQLQMLCRHWNRSRNAQSAMVMVHPGSTRSDIPAQWSDFDLGQAPAPCAYLECPAEPLSRRMAALSMRFAQLVAEVKPAAVVVAGSSYELLQQVTMARSLGVPVIRLADSETDSGAMDAPGLTADLLNRCGDLVCVPTVLQHQRLLTQGLCAWRLARVTPLTGAVLSAAAPSWPSLTDTWHQLKLAPEKLPAATRPFGLLSAQVAPSDLAKTDLLQWLSLARHAQEVLPLVWLVGPQTQAALSEASARSQLQQSGVQVAPADSFVLNSALLKQARLLVSGPGRFLVNEARVLGVPCVNLSLRDESRAQRSGTGLTQVGSSRTQYLTAVRTAAHTPLVHRDLADLNESGLSELTSQLSKWLSEGDALPFQLHPHSAVA